MSHARDSAAAGVVKTAEAVIAAAGSGKKMGSETVELPASVLMRNSVKNELPRSKQRETGKPKQ